LLFFDGPALLGALEAVAAGMDIPARDKIPAELLQPNTQTNFRWPDCKHWVAGRITLPAAPYAHPVQTARDYADAHVTLASFNGSRAQWRPLSGFVHLVEGGRGSQTFGFEKPIRYRDFESPFDYVTDQLDELARTHPPSPESAEELHQLIAPIRDLLFDDDAQESEAAIVATVRAVTRITSRSGCKGWESYLECTFGGLWVRSRMVDELINAVLPIVTNGPFVIACGITNADQITRDVIHSRGRLRVDHHIPSALDAVEQLSPLLPRQHAESRRLADLAHRLSTPGRRANWARELEREHSALVARLARCRNSLSHGGPYDAELGATVKPFAIQCARWTVRVCGG